MNRNVVSVLCLCGTRSVCNSLATSAALATYIVLRTGDNERVGWAVGAQGFASMVAALPAAYVGDNRSLLSRRGVVAFAVAVGAAAAAVVGAAVTALNEGSVSEQYHLMCVGAALWGLWMGAHSATVEAIFADSVETQARSRVYSIKAAVTTAGNAAGPLVSILVFWWSGHDEWRKAVLERIMLTGAAAFALPAAFALCGLREKDTLGAASEALLDPPPPPPTERGGDVEESASRSRKKKKQQQQQQQQQQHRRRRRRRWLIPYTVVASDLFSMLGAGMTVKYFPLFFWRDCGLGPIAVNAIAAAGPLGIAAASMIAQRASERFGRVPTTLATKAAGIGLLLAMVFVRDTRLVVALYLCRTWLMNCSRGLTKSILNDYVQKAHRAKWNAFESINLFSWSGSAVLGGVLIKSHGYRFTFLLTAALQLLAALGLLTIAPLVHAEKKNMRVSSKRRPSTAENINDPSDDDSDDDYALLDDDDDDDDDDDGPNAAPHAPRRPSPPPIFETAHDVAPPPATRAVA